MTDHDTCHAGVSYEKFKGMPFNDRPCFCRGGNVNGGCEFAKFPTAEELAAEDAELEKLFANTATARAAIVASLGGPWKKGTPSAGGKIDCPVCKAKDALRFSRSGYNGHIHAQCSTPECVAWME